MQEQELRSMASQLSCPKGDAGVDFGNKMNELNQFITAKAIEKLSAKKSESIVEIGPGNGSLSVSMLDALGVDGHYLGIELSETMAAELHRTLAGKPCRVGVVCDDCLGVKLESGSVDGIMGVNVLYFIEDPVKFFMHIIDWMKPDGRAVFAVRSDKALKGLPFTQYGFKVRSTDEIELHMNRAGFTSIESMIFEEGVAPFGDTMIAVDSVILVAKKS
ncbi:class I SAM-dependent methyltransferase [Microbulbifer sp. OS29]|uniref:Class I SAM-dependent methyltransferase n=1 Tax=Microbulbifer okhotskensis TaxID=2926617 RepID=A0A9X2J4E8_9GAMM|nr:class I SAM-dependent methyltransferase [Microbulbifer okhotskensis]MCO1334467.1 class I SAM-dependent methyltransferase [Microbulbifer okhotskensis]